MKCMFHRWNGCTCTKCGKTRDESHDWNECTCKICGKTRDEHHDWNGCTCKICGKNRNSNHDFVYIREMCKYVCHICGKDGNTVHSFVKEPNSCVEVCSVCGKKGATIHSFVGKSGECVEVCSVCHLERAKEHHFVNGICEICGKEDVTKSLKYGHGVWTNTQNEVKKYHSFTDEEQTKLIQSLNLMDMADFITTTAANKNIVWLSNQMQVKLIGAAELGHHDEVCNALKRIGEASAISTYMNASISNKYNILTAIMLKYATKERSLFADDSV